MLLSYPTKYNLHLPYSTFYGHSELADDKKAIKSNCSRQLRMKSQDFSCLMALC